MNPETGEKPVFGQLPQGNIQPHVEMLRILSTQFSAATGLSVTDTGVVNDANPTSSDAILAHFKNLAMPSVAITADAAIKIASAREGFSQTDIFLEMIGFDQADIRRIKSQEARARGEKILTEEFAVENNDEGMA